MAPGDRHALSIEAGGEPIVVVGPVDVVLDVFFAGPDHLDRTIDLLGDLHRLGDEIHLEPPAEAAAEQMVMNADLLGRQAGHLRGGGLGAGRDLGAHPDVAAVLAYVDGAVHRLHRGVREERHLVDCLDLLGGAGHDLGHIALGRALLARDHARLLRGRLELLHDIGGAELGVRALVPADVERGKALLGRPHVIGDHRHGAAEANHPVHAFNRLRLGVIDARELAAEHRTGGDGGDFHTGDLHVDAVLGLAIDLVLAVEALDRGADELEVLRVLERDLVRHRQRCSLIDQGPVLELAAGRHVDHLPFSARQEFESTFQVAHAADTSILRAAAPARRSGSQAPRTDVEPPVA